MSDFGRLIEQEVPRLRRYARALTRDVGQADDLVQSCLVRALAKEHLWQPGSNLRAWILTILHNLHINRIRRLVREQDNAIVASGCLALAQTEPSARLDLLDVERAIGKLPELQRRVILLIGLEGMRYDEAAQILAVPIGTIRSRIARARQTLRELLERDINAAALFDRSILRTQFSIACADPEQACENEFELSGIAQPISGKGRRSDPVARSHPRLARDGGRGASIVRQAAAQRDLTALHRAAAGARQS